MSEYHEITSRVREINGQLALEKNVCMKQISCMIGTVLVNLDPKVCQAWS